MAFPREAEEAGFHLCASSGQLGGYECVRSIKEGHFRESREVSRLGARLSEHPQHASHSASWTTTNKQLCPVSSTFSLQDADTQEQRSFRPSEDALNYS